MLLVLAHLESAASGPHHLPRTRRVRRLGGMPRSEEMEPQLPMGGDPQIPLADGDEDGRLRDAVRVEVVELHAIVMRERPHESVRQQDEAMLVKGHEAHDIAVAWPRLWLTQWSDPLRPIGVGNRTEKAIIDERLECLHGYVRQTPRVCLNDNGTGHGCDGEYDYDGEPLSLSLPCLSLSPSPQRSLF